MAGARSVLAAKIAEEETARRQRLIPLLEEQAAVERLSYEYEAAKASLRELLALDAERIWSWIELGDLMVTTAALDQASNAFHRSLSIASRLAAADPGNAGWQRDLAICHERLGTVYLQQEKREEARLAFEQALRVYGLLMARNPGDVQSQVFSMVPRWRLAGVDPLKGHDHLRAALVILQSLAVTNRLDANRLKWIPQMEAQLANLKK